jgi:secreted Zn-dependent insulinase-like peptidase
MLQAGAPPAVRASPRKEEGRRLLCRRGTPSPRRGYPHATLKLAITSRSLPEGAMRCSDAARLSLFVSMLKEAKEEPFLMAALAGTSAEVISTFWGIEVTVSGFESSVLAVASLVRAAIHAVVDDAKEAEDTFLLQREEMVGSLRGACRKPGALASDMIWAARSQASHRSRELCSSLEALTYAEFRAWADDFVREAGVRCGLWVGASGSTSAAILAVVAFGDGSEARAPLPMPTPSTTLCPGHATVVYGRTSEVSNNNRTVQLVFDWGASADPEALATLRLVVECVEEGASEELRTRQQLGYEVILGVEESGDRLYLTLRVQSHDVEPAHLLCHMLAFLREGVPELFAEMDEEDFADRKTSVAESFLECPSMCRHTAEHWWESIERSIQGGRMTDSTVNFQWKKEAADAVEAATATALLAVYLSRTAASRGAACVVAVAVGGGGCPEEGAHRPLEPLWAALEREGFVAELRADRTVEPAADATLIGGCDNADRTVCCSICSIRWGDEVGPSGEGELHVH